MKRLLWVALLLGGCAGAPTNQDSSGSGESSARHRARIHTDLGSGYYAQRNIAVALEEFTAAVRIDPSYAQAHNGLGLVYAMLHEDDKADASFRKALQLDAANSESHNNYGTFLCSRNRVDESIKEFLAALKNPLYTTPETAWLNAGICALKKGDDKNAETYLQNALSGQPNLRAAHYQLANIYYGRGQIAPANTHIQQALQYPDPSPDMVLLGLRIARAVGDRNTEASLAMLLRNKFPNSVQAKAAEQDAAQTEKK